MTKPWIKLLALLAALSLLAAACGSDDDDSTGSDDAHETTDSTEAMEDEETTETTEAMEDEETTESTEATDDTAASAQVTLEEECATYDGLQAPDGFTVNLVTDIGKIDDGTFNQFAYEGMQGALDCFGIEDSSFIETVSEADYAANIATSLEADPNVIVTVGFLITTDTEAAANGQPGRQLHRHRPVPGRVSRRTWSACCSTRTKAASSPVALAASLSETGVIGVVAGREDVPPVVKFVNGYDRRRQVGQPRHHRAVDLQRELHRPGQGRIRCRPVHR